jgi:N6-adenosine-specific RNA methylase IME4
MPDLAGIAPPPLVGFKRPALDLSPAVLEPLPTIDGGWQCLLADPPWRYHSYAPTQNHHISREIERHYRTMTLQEIIDMPVKKVVARDCHLFLWTTGPYLEKCFAVAKAWGFKYSGSGFVWIKLTKKSGDAQYQLRTMREWLALLHTGLGFTTRKNAEFCLLFRRGRARRIAKDIHEIIIAPRREHSRKPDETFDRVERYCAGPRLELFGRQARPDWTVWGNESAKFDGATA